MAEKKRSEIKEKLATLKKKVIEKIGEVKHPLNLALYQQIYEQIETIEEWLKRVVDE